MQAQPATGRNEQRPRDIERLMPGEFEREGKITPKPSPEQVPGGPAVPIEEPEHEPPMREPPTHKGPAVDPTPPSPPRRDPPHEPPEPGDPPKKIEG